jgi:hypothetical protein
MAATRGSSSVNLTPCCIRTKKVRPPPEQTDPPPPTTESQHRPSNCGSQDAALVRDVTVKGGPLGGRVLAVARLAAALGARQGLLVRVGHPKLLNRLGRWWGRRCRRPRGGCACAPSSLNNCRPSAILWSTVNAEVLHGAVWERYCGHLPGFCLPKRPRPRAVWSQPLLRH